ncbi:MAG: NAD(P)-dependent oxidoreductase [Candidatus Aureabacteria bacterium]|nr:NAD(P)-dependent oxidoreductase [Candidatus Auribacterota bacterium]
MEILFTGASSFTGYWFVRTLAEAGHRVRATFTLESPAAYSGLRAERVTALLPLCEPVFGCRFGDEKFISAIQGSHRWDLFCHHAAEAADYRSEKFDVSGALAANTLNLAGVLDALGEKGCRAAVLTGSVFEQDEGRGDDPRAFSPYGLSKGFTWQLFRYRCARAGFRLGKFVIPNPFGPYEEERFTSFLVRSWTRGEKPAVKTPAYVRDNIHVGLLARAYAKFAEETARGGDPVARLNPSGYAESQGDFTSRFAAEMERRLPFPCPFDLAEQVDFPEPRVRVNTDPAAALVPGWDEPAAWDELAAYYRRRYPAAR